MIFYRIAKNVFDKNDLVFGIDGMYNFDCIEKINNGLKLCNPNMGKVPYYNKNTMYVFQSLDAIKTFLFDICKLTLNDIEELEDLGYKFYELDLEVYSKAFSVFFATFFEDECLSYKEYNLTGIFSDIESMEHFKIVQPKVR